MTQEVPIGSLVEAVATRDPSRVGDPEFVYVDLSAVDQDVKEIRAPRTIARSDAPSRARQVIHHGDVLVSTVRPNLNGVAHVPEALSDAIASTGFTVLRPGPKLDSRYLFHWVRTHRFVAEMVKKATGASYPAISDTIVRESLVPLLPLEEQRRIAAILDQTDALRAKRREVLTALNSLADSIYAAMFGTARDPLVGTVFRLGDVLRLKSGQMLSAVDRAADGRYPVYGANGVIGAHDRYLFEGSMLTIGRVGACGSVHRTRPRSWITDNALYVSETTAEFEPSFLYHSLRLADLGQYAGRSAQPLISAGRIAGSPILVPPVAAQELFAERIEAVESTAGPMGAVSSRLDALFSSLQDRAFKGEL